MNLIASNLFLYLFLVAPLARASDCDLNLSVDQKKEIAAFQIRQFERRWRLEDGKYSQEAEAEILRFNYPLFVRLYLLRQKEPARLLTMTQACHLIPIRNTASKIKYVRMAVEHGFLLERPDPKDARRKFICPTPLMIDLVERELTIELDDRFQLAAKLFSPSESDSRPR